MGVVLENKLDTAGMQRAHRKLANYYLLRYAAELKEYRRRKKAFLDSPGDTAGKAGGRLPQLGVLYPAALCRRA